MIKKISLKFKISLLTLFSLLILSFILSSISLYTSKTLGIQLIKEKILGISIATSHNIDTNKLNNLISILDSTDAYYKELFEKFNKIKKENHLTFLYIGYIKDGKFI